MILFVALTVLVAHLILGLIIWLRVRKLYSYPGLFGFPILGNIYYFYKTMFIFSSEDLRINMVQVAEKYGKNGICFHVGYGFSKLVIVSSPLVIKQIGFHPNLKDKPDYPFKAFRTYLNGPFSRVKTDGSWKVRRKEYNNLLKKSRVENNFYDTFLKSADQLVELMFASPYALDTLTAVLKISQVVTMKTLFGFENSLAWHPEVIRHIYALKNMASLLIANPKIVRIIFSVTRIFDFVYLQKIGKFRKMVLREIHKNINNSYQDLPSEDTESYRPLPMCIASRTERRKNFDFRLENELQEVFASASFTISATISSMLTFFAVLPDIQERAWEEQYEIFGDDAREPTLEDLQQMKYLDRFIKESLRFAGPSYLAKQTSGDVEIDGITIPKDVTVVYLLDFMRKDPNNWKDPEVFDPDRFLEENEIMKYALSPFGIGIRSCAGITFAMTQMKIVLSKVLRRTKLSPLEKYLKFEDLKFEAYLSMEVKNPPLLQVEKRV